MLSPRQREAIGRTRRRLNVYEGAVSSGKTFASTLAFASLCETGPPGPFMIVGKTERTLERNVIAPLDDLLPGAVVRNRGLGVVRIGNRVCYLAGANDLRSENKIRGLTVAAAYGDEVTLWPESFFKMLLSRLRVPGARLIATTNPDSPYHWFARFMDTPELDLYRARFTLDDNPALDDEYVKALKIEYGPPSSLWYRRFVLGQWVVAEGAVYEAFDMARHVIPAADAERIAATAENVYIGVDHGVTNPFHAVLVADVDGSAIVVDEWRWDSTKQGRQMTDVDYVDGVAAWADEWAARLPAASNPTWYVDPAAASFRLALWRRGVGHVRPADNAVTDGIRTVASLLGLDRLRVSDRASHLIREVTGYRWDEKAQQRGDDTPVKQDDHGTDALRYAIHTSRYRWRLWSEHGTTPE